MTRTFFKASLILTLIGGIFPTFAQACEPPSSPAISDYVQNPKRAVLTGTVISTTPGWRIYFGARRASTIRVSKWYSGKLKKDVVTVPHGIQAEVSPITICAPPAIFSGKTGEQWLIMGEQNGDVIEPDDRLSARMEGGRLPADVLRQLKALRTSQVPAR